MAYDTLWHTHSAGRGATSVCGLSTTPASESSRNAVVIESFQTYAWFIVYNVVPYVIISNILVSNIMVGFPFWIIVIPTGASATRLFPTLTLHLFLGTDHSKSPKVCQVPLV